jgi:hypothetical protein
MTQITDYERGYLDAQKNRDAGGDFRAGNCHYASAPPYTQGYIDGWHQKQGRIEDPR